MSTPHHILVATDLSNFARRALARGLSLAQATGARCTVLHALGLDALGSLRELIGERAEAVTEQALAHQRQALAALVAEAAGPQGVPATARVEPGLAATVVPACADAAGADLVVVGARGDGAVRRFLIGSTASHLLRKSRCPVLVVGSPCTGPYQRVLVPVDFSPASEASVRLARAVAPQAPLLLLHVFEVPFEGLLHDAGVSPDEVRRYRAEARVRAQRELHALAARAGLSASEYVAVVERGEAGRRILAEAARTRCDLIVMGKHGTHLTEELLLGSVTARVLAESPSDLLVVVDPRGTPAASV